MGHRIILENRLATEIGLRQEILEDLGWKLHRVWSTETQLSESLRRRLIDLRELEIKPDFPDSPHESELLRKTLLNEFLETRPKTRDEWFKKIPHHLRVRVDSKQVAKYLDRVLEIITSYGA